MTALMAALMCILGPLSIPIGPIPVSLTLFAVFLSPFVIGRWKASLATLIYLLIGLVGVPVFSGFQGGPGKLFGPTGGFLISFVPAAFIAGLFIDRYTGYKQMLGCLPGLLVSYAIGTLWLSFQAKMSITAALSAAVLPFIIWDLIKIVLATLVGRRISAALHKQAK